MEISALDGEGDQIRTDVRRIAVRNKDWLRLVREGKLMKSANPDVLIAHEGTISLFSPVSRAAKEWIEEYVQELRIASRGLCD